MLRDAPITGPVRRTPSDVGCLAPGAALARFAEKGDVDAVDIPTRTAAVYAAQVFSARLRYAVAGRGYAVLQGPPQGGRRIATEAVARDGDVENSRRRLLPYESSLVPRHRSQSTPRGYGSPGAQVARAAAGGVLRFEELRDGRATLHAVRLRVVW